MSKLYMYILLLVMLISCSDDATPYSYLHDPDVIAETVDIKLNISQNNAGFLYLIQANEIYLVWGNGSKDTEYVLKDQRLIDSIKPINTTYPQSGIYDLKLKEASGLKKLDFSKIADTAIVRNAGNSVSELVLTRCENIEDLRFANQPIVSVNLSECTTLRTLYCGYTEGKQSVTGLEKLKALENLSITGDLSMPTIDLSANDSLKNIVIAHTDSKLIKLDGLTKVKSLELRDNAGLGVEALNLLFAALPQVTGTGYFITLAGNKGDEGCDKSIATRKGWIFR